MKKHSLAKGLLLAAAFTATSAAIAQTTVTESSDVRVETVQTADKHLVETNHFWNNWFVTAQAGAQMYFGDHEKQMKFKDRLSPAISVGIGKWFTPGIGVRVMYDGYQFKGVTQDPKLGTDLYDWTHSKDYTTSAPPMYKQTTKYFQFRSDVLFNLCHLIGGYKEDRFYSFIPYFGLGYVRTDDTHLSKEISANVGILQTFRLCDPLDLSLDIRGMLVNDRFDGEVGERSKDGALSVSLGLVYKFKKRGWGRSTSTTIYDLAEANRLRQQLSDSEAEAARLKDALANQKTERVVETSKEIVATPAYVTFPINKTTLSKEARVTLGLFADAIKQTDSKSVYVITGLADASTGNSRINERLSKGRAEAVYKCLTEEFGVNPSQLEVSYKGGVDNIYYDEPRLSRAVITRVK